MQVFTVHSDQCCVIVIVSCCAANHRHVWRRLGQDLVGQVCLTLGRGRWLTGKKVITHIVVYQLLDIQVWMEEQTSPSGGVALLYGSCVSYRCMSCACIDRWCRRCGIIFHGLIARLLPDPALSGSQDTPLRPHPTAHALHVLGSRSPGVWSSHLSMLTDTCKDNLDFMSASLRVCPHPLPWGPSSLLS